MTSVIWSASSSDRVVRCPSSAVLSRVSRLPSPEAQWGTHVHQFLENAVRYDREYALANVDASVRSCCERIPVGDILEELADGEGINSIGTEVPMLYCPATGTAEPIDGVEYRGYPSEAYRRGIPGTADLAIFTEAGRQIIVDYKTGANPPRARESWQLSVLSLAAARLAGTSHVTVAIVSIDHDGGYSIDRHDPGSGELVQNEVTLLRVWQLAQEASVDVSVGEVPPVSPGEHCHYCPAMAACPAYTSLARELGAGSLDAVADRVALMSTVEAGAAWEKLARAKKVVDAIDKALRGRLAAEGGTLPMPDGRHVRIVAVNRRVIDGRRALPMLAERGVHPHVTVTAASVEQAAKDAGVDPGLALALLECEGVLSTVRTEQVRVSK